MPLSGADLLPPVTPSKIVCVGRNYREHASELLTASLLGGPANAATLPVETHVPKLTRADVDALLRALSKVQEVFGR